jgi:hypothetical protein
MANVYNVGGTFLSAFNFYYTFVNYHHGKPSKNKSVWTVSLNDEMALFDDTVSCSLINNHERKKAFNINLKGNKPCVLGETIRNGSPRELLICQFEAGSGVPSSSWHGYPADYMDSKRERPSEQDIQVFISKGLKDSDARKMRKAQRII